MSPLDDALSAQLPQLEQAYRQGAISLEIFKAALVGLGLSGEQITRIERQINVAGDYHDQRAVSPAPDSSPTLDADTALARYLRHLIDSNRRLQLQGIRSSSGLVSIELEEIYITLTATERRTITDEQQWIEEMGHRPPPDRRQGWRRSGGLSRYKFPEMHPSNIVELSKDKTLGVQISRPYHHGANQP